MWSYASRSTIRQARRRELDSHIVVSPSRHISTSPHLPVSFCVARHNLAHLCICVALFSVWLFAPQSDELRLKHTPVPTVVADEQLDAVLQRAAFAALVGREGTAIVLDAQTGRVRAVANERLAYEGTFPPGSAIKPFTMLTALRTGALDADTRRLCRRRYVRDGLDTTCSHPVVTTPLKPAQALGYSCNYFFAKLGERLSEDDFNTTLDAYGFGARTGINEGRDAAGKWTRGHWHVGTTIGEGDQLLVTPIQMIMAYSALINGGHLYAPERSSRADFHLRERATLELAPAHRSLIIEGMRGAVEYGTAEHSDLRSLPLNVFGKTGTATEIGGFRTHGWFIGFATDEESATKQTPFVEPAPSQVKIAVLVFLKRAQGKQAAEAARTIFAEYARAVAGRNGDTGSGRDGEKFGRGDAETQRWNDAENEVASSPHLPIASSLVRVHLAHEDVTRTMSLDDYVFGVLAAEASTEDEFAALKAQAVISRTFALKNRGRHARDAYDFCNTTHCQRFLAVTNANARPGFYELLRRAVDETSGEILRDQHGQIVNAFFHAACGGATANIETLWGQSAHEPYERGIRDDYCETMPYRNWTDVLPASQLVKALREDSRSDVGARLDNITVIKRDATGRVEMIALEGERRRLLRGWDFKIIVGRTLGWSVLKSSRFEVARAGANFVFRGSGFGHGLGLCQNGAHVMARRGASYRQILDYYFPGTNLSEAAPATRHASNTSRRDEPQTLRHPALASSLHHAASTAPRLILSSENFRISYPPRVERRDAEEVLRTLEAAHSNIEQRLLTASIALPALPALEVFVYQTTGDFTGATGQPAWVAAVTNRQRIDLQPVATLRRRSILTTTLRHEYAHAVIDVLSHARAPRWLAEGLAAHFAGEGAMLTSVAAARRKLTVDELEERLAQPASGQEMRALYAAAYREVSALIRQEGEASVWRRIAHS